MCAKPLGGRKFGTFADAATEICSGGTSVKKAQARRRKAKCRGWS